MQFPIDKLYLIRKLYLSFSVYHDDSLIRAVMRVVEGD